ncbi:MAG: hypothetical protein ABR865_03375 [Terracidiphilus sp.]|jgi:hypothetical protein
MIKADSANQTKRGMSPMRLTSRLSIAAPIVALAMLVSANNAFAQKTETIEGGRTTVALASGFVSALGSLDVTPGTVGPTRLYNGTVNFPVTGGAIDLDTAASQILHSGGLTLTAGQTTVTLQSFIIDTTGTPVITGLVSVDGKLLGRLPLFDLALPSGITLPLKPHDGQIILKGVGVTLDSTAAGALNSVFHVSAFTGGFGIGTAKVIIDLPGCYDEDRD